MLAGALDTAILGGSACRSRSTNDPGVDAEDDLRGHRRDHIGNDPSTGGAFGRYGLSWQKVFLEGDTRYRKFLILPRPANASDFKSNVM